MAGMARVGQSYGKKEGRERGKESEVGRENGRFNIEGGVWISRDQDKHVLKLQRAGNFPCA
jgi:hypothetical protein